MADFQKVRLQFLECACKKYIALQMIFASPGWRKLREHQRVTVLCRGGDLFRNNPRPKKCQLRAVPIELRTAQFVITLIPMAIVSACSCFCWLEATSRPIHNLFILKFSRMVRSPPRWSWRAWVSATTSCAEKLRTRAPHHIRRNRTRVSMWKVWGKRSKKSTAVIW